MIWSGLRTRLARRFLEDGGADRYPTATLNELLTLGQIEMQKEIMKVDPEAFSKTSRASIVANQELYAFPTGIWYERELRILTDGEYERIDRVNMQDRRDVTTGSTQRYYRYDRNYFGLSPIPESAVTNGLEIVWVYTLAMGADGEQPLIHPGLHMGIVYFAEILGAPEAGDQVEGTLKELARVLAGIPQYYIQSASTPPQMRVDLDKGY